MGFLDNYDKESTSENKKFKFQDGIYKVLIESVKLDLENKYGATCSLMLRHKNNSVSWLNAKIINGDNPFPLKVIAEALGFRDQLREVIVANDGNEKAVIEGYSKLLEPSVGKYYSATFKTGAKGYQNIYLNSETTRAEFESYQMPKMVTEAASVDTFGAPPSMNDNSEIPF